MPGLGNQGKKVFTAPEDPLNLLIPTSEENTTDARNTLPTSPSEKRYVARREGFVCPGPLAQAIRDYCYQTGMKKTPLFIKAIEEYIANHPIIEKK